MHAAHQDDQAEGPEMMEKQLIRFYVFLLDKIGALLNEIHVDINSKSEVHQLLKTGFRSIGPASAFYPITFLHFLTLSAAPGFFYFLRREEPEN